MHLEKPRAGLLFTWLGKGFVRFLLVLIAAAAVAAVAAGFGIAHDYGYLHASILTGSPSGQYYALATRLAGRAEREHGTLTVVPTAGSIENIKRLAAGRGHCAEMFAHIQDGTPVSADAGLELLGRLPKLNPCCDSLDKATPFTPLATCVEHPSGSAPKIPARRTSCINCSRIQICGA